ncbi:MAG TPA: thiamine ABC transporter substrate-binding protein [Spirochaetales bacterium]|nr:thiamine ABC transporter substrate-binding protein [Spirochaetales bacterium]HPG86615.1 thiamine ABC transporter substrate-binding protein [Spirochaetales bacterium]HPM71394.1 thiamine ABC transporter substrate-binding protein [Spirochaetales bacterium]
MLTHTHGARVLLAAAAISFAAIATSCVQKDDAQLVVYAYDSFASEWGPGPIVIPAFEKATGITVELVVPGDAGQVLARAVDEKRSPRADVIVGIDGNLLPKALAAGVLAAYEPKGSASVPARLRLDDDWRLTPYDWSSFCVMWDSEKLAVPPASLEDLTKPEYGRKLILMDPRTSTPGLGFVEWTAAIYGDGLSGYWKRLAPSILTLSPGWDTGYGLFTAGEAPLVISYTTSAAYHAEYETAGRYKALEFADGHPIQVEGAGIVVGARHREAAEAFIDFMLGDEFQAALPLTNWMYPVNEGVVLPPSYEASKKPAKTVSAGLAPNQLDEAVRTALDALQGR